MTVSNEIISVLEYLGDKFGIAVDWTSENIIPYVQTLCEKIVMWKLSLHTMWLIVCGVLFFASIALIVVGVKKTEEDFDFITLVVIFSAIAIISFIVALYFAYSVITDVTFPEKVIIDYAKGLMKQ